MKKIYLRLLVVVALLLCWSLTAVAAEAGAGDTNALATAGAKATNLAGSAASTGEPGKVWLTFGLDRIEMLQARPFANIPLWQFLASFIFVFLAFYVSKFLDYFVGQRLQKWAERTKTKFDDIIVNLLRGPVKVISFVVLLHIAMEVYSWPAGLSRFLSSGLKIIVAVSITYVLLKAVDALVGAWREKTTTTGHEDFSKQLLPLIGKSIKVFLVIVIVLVTSQNLGLNVTGLIASLSIGGLALGLAAQDTVANLFGAVAVLVDKPFKVGDRIVIDNTVDGSVEQIGFRSTRVRTLDGHLVTVPNKTMGNATITNITLRPSLKTVLDFGLTYDTPPSKVQRAVDIITETFKNRKETSDLLVTFNKFTDFTLNVQVVHWWKGKEYRDFLKLLHECNLEIKAKFDEEKIEFAFPTRTLYVKQEGDGEKA